MMDGEHFAREAVLISVQLPPSPRMAIIGSTSFWHTESQATCELLGKSLAAFEPLVVLTGGVEGSGEAVGRSYHAARLAAGAPGGVFHILPRGYPAWDYGQTLFAGANMQERREVLGRLAPVYVVIEGGPGTEHEARVALAHGAILVPIVRSGGVAADLHQRIARPLGVPSALWGQLNCPSISAEAVARATVEIVRTCLKLRQSNGLCRQGPEVSAQS